jgi:surface carbohydrate biosynthesis protein
VREVDVVYLYEHAARELEVACAVLAHLRKKHSIHAEIIHWPTGFPHAVTRIRPKVVILPFCYSERSYEALLAYWREARFFNITWEQLFYPGNQKAKTPRGKFALNHVIHHAWSEFYADFLLKNGLAEKRIFLNGQPAYALYDTPYRAYFCSRTEIAERNHLDPSRRWIFFPENYNWAFYSEKTIRQFVESGQDLADINAMREYCERSLHEVIHWLADIACDNQFEVILRPRPSTSLNEFRLVVEKMLRQLPLRLHIIQQGSIREWILASDLVFSSHSTSLIEAAVAGKPAFMVEPYKIPAALKASWQELLTHVETQSQFLEICFSNHHTMDERLAKWARKALMSHGDSISNLADFIVSLLGGKVDMPPPPSPEIATPTLRWIPPVWMWSVYWRVKQGVRHPVTSGVESGFVKDVVKRSVIEDNVQRWAYLLNRVG